MFYTVCLYHVRALNRTDVDVLHQWIDRRIDRYLGLSVSQTSLTHEQRILVCV